MATYAKLLQESNGDIILPYTRDSLVYHDNNYSLDNAIACWYDDPSTKVLARIRCSGSAAVTNMARDAYLPITASDFMVPSGWTFSKLLSSISAVSLADGEILTKCAAMTVGGGPDSFLQIGPIARIFLPHMDLDLLYRALIREKDIFYICLIPELCGMENIGVKQILSLGLEVGHLVH